MLNMPPKWSPPEAIDVISFVIADINSDDVEQLLHRTGKSSGAR